MNVSPRAEMTGANTYGTTWLKALYRGYTDSSFTQYSEQPPWQGTQGPTIRSEVGDLIEIMFVNKLSQNCATMHSMGLEYSKHSEGGDYPNNTAPGMNVVLPETAAVNPGENGVGPGSCVVYKWMVDETAGPVAGEPSRVSHLLSSLSTNIQLTMLYRSTAITHTLRFSRTPTLASLVHRLCMLLA